MELATWIFSLVFGLLAESTQAKGSNLIRYRVVRYGSYYSSVYYSYSGGKGYARYSRVYSHVNNKYPALYSYMFDWFKTDQFKVYKNSPSGSISVCKNYEANENGTYLGIFTCPLPFVPEEQAYCCGETNAQYCCTFWDVPTNLAAACIAMVMGLQVLLAVIYIIVQFCKVKIKSNEGKKERIAVRRIGVLRRLGRRVTVGSIWAQALFEKVHAPSNYKENDITVDDSEPEEEINETVSRNECNFVNVMNSTTEPDLDHNKYDVAGIEVKHEDSSTCQSFSSVQTETDNYAKNLFVKDAWKWKHGEDVDKSYTNKSFLNSWTEKEHLSDVNETDLPIIKPLRLSPRIKFNSESEAKFSTYQFK